MKLIFAFGLSFQLPVVLSLLARIGVINSVFLKERRKYVVVMIFAAAAILTPPDPITQIGLAIPLLILYELSIFSVNMIEKKTSDHSFVTTYVNRGPNMSDIIKNSSGGKRRTRRRRRSSGKRRMSRRRRGRRSTRRKR